MDLGGWIARILRSEPALDVQFAELLVLALVIKAVLVLCGTLVKAVTRGKPYLPRAISITKASLKVSMGIDAGDAFALYFWEFQWGPALQHAVGGLLCVPLLCPSRFVSRETGLILARHGALCEVAWELGDVVERACQVFFGGEPGRRTNPPRLLALLAAHHSMSMALVIPMNLTFPECEAYFQLVFLLQGAAAVALLSQQYSCTLDIDRPSELAQMFWLTFFNFCVMTMSRLIFYVPVVYQILRVFSDEGRWGFLVVGVAVGCFLMPVIGVIFISDILRRLRKFGARYLKELPPPSTTGTSSPRACWGEKAVGAMPMSAANKLMAASRRRMRSEFI